MTRLLFHSAPSPLTADNATHHERQILPRFYGSVATLAVGSAKPTVDCWLSGSNKTSTRAFHGFDSRERQAVVMSRRDATKNDQGYGPGKLLLFFTLLRGSASANSW